jgi:hypothetical protein
MTALTDLPQAWPTCHDGVNGGSAHIALHAAPASFTVWISDHSRLQYAGHPIRCAPQRRSRRLRLTWKGPVAYSRMRIPTTTCVCLRAVVSLDAVALDFCHSWRLPLRIDTDHFVGRREGHFCRRVLQVSCSLWRKTIDRLS